MCLENVCKPSKDCSVFGDAAIGTDAALARARCETLQQAETERCRTEQNKLGSVCGNRQYEQVSQCTSTVPPIKTVDFCNEITTILSAAIKSFTNLKGKELDRLGAGVKRWAATSSVGGITTCEVREPQGDLAYFACEVTSEKNLSNVATKMIGIAKGINQCLNDKYQIRISPYGGMGGNNIWLYLKDEPNGIAPIQLRTWKFEDEFVLNLYFDAAK